MPRPCKKACCKNLYNPYERPTRNLFKCRFPNCGQSFKYKSVLTLHEFKEHTQEKSKPVAYVKPFTQLALVSLDEAEEQDTNLDLLKESRGTLENIKKTHKNSNLLKNDKTPKLVLNDILAPHRYIVKSTGVFSCPICQHETTPGAIYSHIKSKHKTILKFVKPKVQCIKCGILHHSNGISKHKKSCKSKRKENILSICY